MTSESKDALGVMIFIILGLTFLIWDHQRNTNPLPDTAMHNETYSCICNCPPQPCK